MKISFDFDGTINTSRGFELAKSYISKGATVYIISARSNKESMMRTATLLGIPSSRVFATGSNTNKVEKVLSLGISKHIDNNPDVVSKLKDKGEKF